MGRKKLEVPNDERAPVMLSPDHHAVCSRVTWVLSLDNWIYTRGQSLAIVTPPGIVTLDEARLSRLITERVKLLEIVQKTVGKGKNRETIPVEQQAHPPAWLCREILAMKSWPGVRELSTITNCPYVLPGGEIVGMPGYDPSTKTILLSSPEIPQLPADTSREEAMRAAARIIRVVETFPFKSYDDRVVWLTALLTAIQRPVISLSVPGFAFNSNKPGTGKGVLINIIGITVWGTPVPTYTYPPDSTEADKLALSLALDGIPAVHLDNIPDGSAYGSAALDSALTCLMKGGRILGVSRCAEGVPLRPWSCTGSRGQAPPAGRHDLGHVLPDDLRDTVRLLNLHDRAVGQELASLSGWDRRRFVAVVEHARIIGTKNPCGLFVRLVRGGLWHFATGDDEASASVRRR
jgi:hypothetical protein